MPKNRRLHLPGAGFAFSLLFALAAASLLLSAAAYAAPDVAGSGDILEPNGFPGVCDQPCYTVTKSFEVYLSGNATVPAGANCAAGNNTYLYTITHNGGSGPFVPALTSFELAVETDDVSSAGEIAGFGISPSSSSIDSGLDIVRWDFLAPAIGSGQSSTKLFVCSPLLPGGVTDSVVSIDGQAGLDASGTCVGPVLPPAGGDPMPCTIGYWKNRADGKKGTLQHFPDPQFDQIADAAALLSGGIFADAAALIADLGSKGNRPADQRARQQLAAFLLDLAAGDLFPENSKCRLFETNQIDTNSCGTGISIGDALDAFFVDYIAGNYLDAKDCADDVNNGIGVIGATQGE